MQSIVIQNPTNINSAPLFCMYCGKQVYEGTENRIVPCAHLAFAYLCIDGSWHCLSSAFAELTADIALSRQTPAMLAKTLRQKGKGDAFLMIEIVYGDEDTVQFSDCLGFFLNPLV